MLLIGIMSGTSADGFDCALVRARGDDYQFIAHHGVAMSSALQDELLSLYKSGNDEVQRMARAAHRHATESAACIRRLLRDNGIAASEITAVGAHGQTIRHCPHASPPYSWQLNNPALLCELLQIDVIADFRSRDIAAGGQGAPLAPLFHAAFFAANDKQICVVNIGGIANISIYDNETVRGFDCGPGNALLDEWSRENIAQNYDEDGNWARSGNLIEELLTSLLADEYFNRAPPKSTGRDYFNLQWLKKHLKNNYKSCDVQCTLVELTAQTIANAINQQTNKNIYLCGGGALNKFLCSRINSLLKDDYLLQTSPIPVQAVEAAGFAYLAAQYIRAVKLNLAPITGSNGQRLLGAWYRA